MPRTIPEIILAAEKAVEIPLGRTFDMQCRTHEVSLARHVAVYVAKKETFFSFAKIAEAFGSYDHKFAMNGFNRVSKDLANNITEVKQAVAKTQETA